MEKVDTLFEDIFALFAFGVAKSSTKSFAFLIWAINVAITLSIIIIYSLEENLFISFDALSKITDTIQLFGPIFVHLCTISICLMNFNLYMAIHKGRDNLENLLKSCDKIDAFRKVQVKKILIFTLKVLFIQSIGMGIEAFLMITLGKREPEWMKSIRARLISSNMNRWLGIQFIFYCDYLGSRFEYFNIIKADIFENSHESEKEFLRKLKLMKIIDVELVKLVQLIQAYFKWMLLLIITLDVIDITINIYWIYGGLSFGNNPNFIQSSLCPVPKIISMLVLFYSSDNMQKQRDNLLTEVYNWKTEYTSVAHGKRRFLLQHFHSSKFMLDANKFFFINYSALIGIAEAISIYMVYLFQFMSETNIFVLAIERDKELNGDKEAAVETSENLLHK